MKRFGLKLILADGRKVYASKRGEIQILTEQQAANLTRMVGISGYTPTLSMFGPAEMFESQGVDFVRVVASSLESADEPVDSTAFLTGGFPAK